MKGSVCIALLCISCVVKSQGVFQLLADKPISFKFELANHVVLVPLTINGMPFSFLLDTGVKETILFVNAEDSLYLNNPNKMMFRGIGIDDGVEGILSTENVVKVGGIAVDSLHWLYVIQGAELDISSDVGVAINGILGSKFFESFPVKIDYLKQRITLFPPDYSYESSVHKYKYLPLSIENNRPYITANMLVDTLWTGGKMLWDMGNTAPLMLFSYLLPQLHIKPPYVEEYIGRGFNGAVYGKRNRIRKVVVADFTLDYPIVAYPDSSALSMSKLATNRIGSVGSQVLQRFHVLIDYQKQALFLRKNRRFSDPFLINMAGIEVQHDGMTWHKEWMNGGPAREKSARSNSNPGIPIELTPQTFRYRFVLQPRYRVSGVRKDSPAARAGIQTGDRLLKVNRKPVGGLSLAKIMSALQSGAGDMLHLTLERGDESYETRFTLVDPIPF